MPECFPVTGRHESRIKENDRVRPFDPVFGIIPVIEHFDYRSQLFRRHCIELLRGVIKNSLGNSGKCRFSGHTPFQRAGVKGGIELVGTLMNQGNRAHQLGINLRMVVLWYFRIYVAFKIHVHTSSFFLSPK